MCMHRSCIAGITCDDPPLGMTFQTGQNSSMVCGTLCNTTCFKPTLTPTTSPTAPTGAPTIAPTTAAHRASITCQPALIPHSDRGYKDFACRGIVGDTCDYICGKGYEDAGNATVECLPTLQFSSSLGCESGIAEVGAVVAATTTAVVASTFAAAATTSVVASAGGAGAGSAGGGGNAGGDPLSLLAAVQFVAIWVVNHRTSNLGF